MESYKIFVDLSADITDEITKKYHIGFMPMNYSIDDKEYLSDKFLTEEEMKRFYQDMKDGKVTKTSQITPFMYKELLKENMENKDKILYFSLSSGLSSTYNNAKLVEEELEEDNSDFKFKVVDSLGATGGIGLLAEIAAINRENGMSLEDNYKFMVELAKRGEYWFYVDDLKYLKRGGRVSASKAFIATTLNIKPIMSINDEGKLFGFGKKIGKKLAAKALVEKYFETRDEKYSTIYVCHGDDINSANYVKKLILEKDSNVNIRMTQICPVIGAHSGPGTVALCHIGKE
ncbi:MAG: DegV family protein [Bacilli bacterium]|nr:DegV family protein [Bacilli bacterium]